MTERGVTARIRQHFAAGRRVQGNRELHRGLWHRSVHLPACAATTLLLAFPAVAAMWTLATVVSEDAASAVVVGAAMPPGWVLYHVFVGMYVGDGR